MDIIEVRENLEKLPNIMFEAEEKYTQAKAQLDYLQDMKKHVLAVLKESYTGSNPERESQAFASEGYKVHLQGIREATIDAGKKGAEFHKLQNQFDACRSLNKNVI